MMCLITNVVLIDLYHSNHPYFAYTYCMRAKESGTDSTPPSGKAVIPVHTTSKSCLNGMAKLQLADYGFMVSGVPKHARDMHRTSFVQRHLFFLLQHFEDAGE